MSKLSMIKNGQFKMSNGDVRVIKYVTTRGWSFARFTRALNEQFAKRELNKSRIERDDVRDVMRALYDAKCDVFTSRDYVLTFIERDAKRASRDVAIVANVDANDANAIVAIA